MENMSIAFDVNKYPNEDAMWADIAMITKILTKQEYEVLTRYEDCGIYILEYAHDNRGTDYGAPRFMLVTVEEQENIEFERDSMKEGDNEEKL